MKCLAVWVALLSVVHALPNPQVAGRAPIVLPAVVPGTDLFISQLYIKYAFPAAIIHPESTFAVRMNKAFYDKQTHPTATTKKQIVLEYNCAQPAKKAVAHIPSVKEIGSDVLLAADFVDAKHCKVPATSVNIWIVEPTDDDPSTGTFKLDPKSVKCKTNWSAWLSKVGKCDR
jgi:hypothetical protein